MEKCNIDHTLHDVMKKYEDQKTYLPPYLKEKWSIYLSSSDAVSQNSLNEAFHLLKKYDLVSEEERHARNKKMSAFLRQKTGE